MIKQVTLLTKCRTLPAGLSVDFRPGVNLLVGDQGCGKSTLLIALEPTPNVSGMKVTVEKDENTRIKFFDFEKLNPRTASGFGNGLDLGLEVDALFMSHGQANVRMLASLCKRTELHTFLLDEPDTGLSPRSALTVAKFFKMVAQHGHQVIASIHNPLIMYRFDEVYSVEHHKWMAPRDFMETQLV